MGFCLTIFGQVQDITVGCVGFSRGFLSPKLIETTNIFLVAVGQESTVGSTTSITTKVHGDFQRKIT